MTFTNLNKYSYRELQEIVRELEHELEYERKNQKLFHRENKILKNQIYNHREQLKHLLKILTSEPENQLRVISQIQNALGVVSSE